MIKYIRCLRYNKAVEVIEFVRSLNTESWACTVPYGTEIYSDTEEDWTKIKEFLDQLNEQYSI